MHWVDLCPKAGECTWSTAEVPLRGHRRPGIVLLSRPIPGSLSEQGSHLPYTPRDPLLQHSPCETGTRTTERHWQSPVFAPKGYLGTPRPPTPRLQGHVAASSSCHLFCPASRQSDPLPIIALGMPVPKNGAQSNLEETMPSICIPPQATGGLCPRQEVCDHNRKRMTSVSTVQLQSSPGCSHKAHRTHSSTLPT